MHTDPLESSLWRLVTKKYFNLMFVFTMLRFKLRNGFTVTINYSCFAKGIVCP